MSMIDHQFLIEHQQPHHMEDILNSQNIIPFSSQGGVPGGTSSK